MAEPVTFDAISAVFQKQIKDLRRPVSEMAKALGAVRERSKDLAPKVMGVFKKIQAAHESLSFVDFARMIDPSVPTFAADKDGVTGYRNHRTYYALTYMRRLDQTAAGRAAAGAGGRRAGGVRDSATDALARALATILQVVKEPEKVWEAVQTEFNFTERLMTRLRKRVDDTKPLFVIPAKPVQIGSVIKMARKSEGEATPAERGRSAA